MAFTIDKVVDFVLLSPAVAEMILSLVFLVKNKARNDKATNMLTASSIMGLLATIALFIHVFIWSTSAAEVFGLLFTIFAAPFTVIGCIKSGKENPNKPSNEQNSKQKREVDEDYEEILAFKDLYDKGVITKEEFEAKKRKILSK